MPRSKLPAEGNPNTSAEERDEKGNVMRRRFYGRDGKAIKNIDFEPHHGHPAPHVHDWDWTKRPTTATGSTLEARRVKRKGKRHEDDPLQKLRCRLARQLYSRCARRSSAQLKSHQLWLDYL